MFRVPYSLGNVSMEVPISPMEATPIPEGAAIVGVYHQGTLHGKLSEGVEGERFLGLSVHQISHQSRFSMVSRGLVSDEKTFLLERTPIAGTVSVFNFDTNAPITAVMDETNTRLASLPDADVLPGTIIVAYYAVLATSEDNISRQGDTWPGIPANVQFKRVGLIKAAQALFTSEWDTTSNWLGNTSGALYTGPRGTISASKTGSKIPGYMEEAPLNSPYLGVTLHVGS